MEIQYRGIHRSSGLYLWRHDDFHNQTYGFRIYARDDKEAMKEAVESFFPFATSFTLWHKGSRNLM